MSQELGLEKSCFGHINDNNCHKQISQVFKFDDILSDNIKQETEKELFGLGRFIRAPGSYIFSPS